MAAYTTIDDPEAYFQVELYTGNASDDKAMVLDGDTDMQPDLVWIKNRTEGGEWNSLFDVVRGVGKRIYSNETNAEETAALSLKSFDSDGFTIDRDNNVNKDGQSFVAWCWSAGTGAGSANTDGSINTTSTSVNTTSKFSISKYTGTGGIPVTIGHGLGVVPTFIIIKKTDGDARNWAVYHQAIGNTHGLILNTNSAKVDNADLWNDTTPTSTLITFSNANETNQGSAVHVAYVFSDVQGFSKFGTYVGDGNIDGPFVYTGFKPAFVLVKASTTDNSWHLQDNKRSPFNLVNKSIYPHLADAEETYTVCDFLSNGFKMRTTNAGMNNDGVTKIYVAFAEAPFVNSEGVPNNAR